MDATLALLMLVLLLFWGSLANAILLYHAVRDWRVVVASQRNGPRQILAVAMIRRKAMRILMQLGLLVLYGMRAGGKASPFIATLVGFWLVIAMTIDTIGDGFDRRMLRWFLQMDRDR